MGSPQEPREEPQLRAGSALSIGTRVEADREKYLCSTAAARAPSSNEVGAVQMGVMASLLGPARAVLAGGALTIGVVALVAWRAPALRRLNLGTYGISPPPAALAAVSQG